MITYIYRHYKFFVPTLVIVTNALQLCLSFFAFNFVFADQLKSTDKIYEKLNSKVDMNLEFLNQDGNTQTLKEIIGHKVLIISLNYYRCTTMCTFQFLNLSEALKQIKFPLGKDYAVASISFDPTDTPKVAKNIHDIWVPKIGSFNAAWNFYVGKSNDIKMLTNQLSFYYEKDDEGNYSHAAALYFIALDGTFTRYLYGIVYDKSDIEQALIDSSHGAIGSFIDKLYSHFKTYNPVRGKYLSLFSSEN